MKQDTFEKSLDRLEEIVEKLETGDLSLDESLKLFEAGVKLSRDCQERLAEAERKIQTLLAQGDSLQVSNINPDSVDESGDEVGRKGSID